MRALASLAAVAFLQSQPPDSCAPKFAVASIHPHQQQPGSYIGFSAEHGTVRAIRTNLKLLIMGSYDVHEFQVSGGPGWIDREWYDIAAKADDDAKDQNVMLMMRCLLADRFKLAFHREKQEQTVFELAVAKNGPRIHKSAPDAAYSMRLSAGGIMTATAMGMSDLSTGSPAPCTGLSRIKPDSPAASISNSNGPRTAPNRMPTARVLHRSSRRYRSNSA